MSTLLTPLISRALLEVGDINAHRVKRPEMLGYFNRVQEKLATELRCLQTDYYFDLVKDEPRYIYPEDAVQIAGIRISRVASPSTLADYYWLGEKFNDEWRNATQASRPSAWVYAYHARPAWFELLNSPVADVVDGGIVTTWRIPVWVDVESTSAVMELPDWLRGTVQEGMQILARITGRERVAALDDWKRWVANIEGLRERIEDPSDDRRAAIRPPNNHNWSAGQR